MTKVININERGTLTLPKELRKRLGIKKGGQVMAEETSEGVLLKTGATFPVEMYSDERLAEFETNNEKALERYFSKKKTR